MGFMIKHLDKSDEHIINNNSAVDNNLSLGTINNCSFCLFSKLVSNFGYGTFCLERFHNNKGEII